ncbi:MAG: hypothetical protein ABW292_24950 [Vicinamibacterales bacterium]
MKILATLAFAAILAGFGSVSAATSGRAPEAASIDAAAAFERLQTLQGLWEAAPIKGVKATTAFELTAGGSVLLERYANPALPGGGHMVTAYHLDGASLILTHYCIARNQPTLRAERYDAKGGEIQFEFLRGANMPSENVGHMRRALYRVEDANHFTTSWEFFENGTKKMTERETFTRVSK